MPADQGKQQKKRIRTKEDDAWDSDEEEKALRAARIREREDLLDRRAVEKTGEVPGEIEAEMDEDERERDAFAARLRSKDKSETKKLVEDRTRQGNAETERRRELANDRDSRKAAIPEIRERARQKYLKEREEQRLLLLEQEIIEERQLFQGQRLTEAERASLRQKEEVLRLAKERQGINRGEGGYAMPEDYIDEQGKIDSKRREKALFGRYEDEPTKTRDGRFTTEQEQWEETQIDRIADKHAPKPKGMAPGEDALDYDYVFDEQQIDFVLDTVTDEGPGRGEDTDLLERIDIAERKAMSIAQVRASLPIYQFREQLLSAINDFQILVIVGETGSGKTTQIPQYLHEAGYTKNGQKIGCTQPRRVAAMSVAARVAEEMGVKLGHEVGYSIRFEDCTSEKTVMKYMTDGMLLREFLTEPDLASYSAIIIDEAHERTLHTDVLFGLVKDIARFRPDLKLLISSATMDAQKFSEFFDGANIFNIPGRPFPVDIYYTQSPEANYLAATITTVLQIHISQDAGDILVFLTGQEEIEYVKESLEQTARVLGNKISELIVAPIYASLPAEMQAKIFEPTPEGARKVVLATNIAETSITIDGIVHVIDTGFAKQNKFNPRTRMESLQVTPCSRASANQRAGRAGRVGPGKCFRLYTQWTFFNELAEDTVPEIQRTNIASVVLMLMSLGIRDILAFDFMDPPPAETIIQAYGQLYALGAVNDKGELTKLGRRMAEFPLDPMMSKTIVVSEKFSCADEIASICGMLSVQSSLFYRPKDKKMMADKARLALTRPEGDHLTLLNVWEQWAATNYSMQWCYENYLQFRSMSRARDVRDQVIGLLERVEISVNTVPADALNVRKAITAGYFYNAARLSRSGDSYKMAKQGQTIYLHPSSGLLEKRPKWVIYHELVLTSKEYMRQVTEIKASWLRELAPNMYSDEDLDDDSQKKMPKMRK